MSTDKTLADVQPGGRVRLGDQRSDLVPGIVRCAKCQFQLVRSNLNMYDGTVTAGDSKTEPCPNGCGPLWPVTWETWAREGWAEAERLHLENAALSAQPSPGGQGGLNYERMFVDACAALAEVSRELGCDPEQGGAEPILAAIAELREALAARQPVGEPATYQVRPRRFPAGEGWREVSKRQFDDRSDFPGYSEAEWERRALYAAPPAQAVDLGQFRGPIAAWSKHCAHSIKGYESYQDSDLPDWMVERRQQVRKCGELLALIDSQAVGNG